uniref:CTP synthase n=1 Tax=Setaria digitata TaxID=48799 RepID=A0A915Q060_9BILA
MVPNIRYIGNYDINAEGKFLWEILCQLRNLGVGRIVTKNEWGRKWPKQPSYLKIVRAYPSMDRWLLRGKLWADWTYRGINLGLYEFSTDLARSDWRLIHKHEEDEFMKCDTPMKPIEYPKSMPLPPYLRAICKNGDVIKMEEKRINLDLCLDPQFEMIKNLFKQVESNHGDSVYEETRPEVWLDLYGDEMPTKVEAWTAGPAELRPHFDNSVPTPLPPELEDLSLPEFKFDFTESESVNDITNVDNLNHIKMVKPVKMILVTGGVISGVGKGIISSSLGVLLKAHGYRVSFIKIDPYINIDAGTFSPFEHGEVFVLDDGGEVDLDLGNYERFLDIRLTRDNNITTGKIYQQVIERERRGDYLGKTVQTIPHVTSAIIEWVERVAAIPVDGSDERPEVCLVELGGTIGDIESMPFVAAFEKFQRPAFKDQLMTVHVSVILEPKSTGEPKTKPMQNSMRNLRASGLTPDLLVCRSERPLNKALREKIAAFGMVDLEQVVGVHDVSNIYKVPLLLHQQNVLEMIVERLQLTAVDAQGTLMLKPNLFQWTHLSNLCDSFEQEVRIAVVGKYVQIPDAYASLNKALRHAAIHAKRQLYVLSEHLELSDDLQRTEDYNSAWEMIKQCHGIVVPGGFGGRGIEGKIAACKYARENNIPFLGICLGMQCAAIEFARNVCGIKDANSTEFDKTIVGQQQVVVDMPEHKGEKKGMGGTMRLGLRETIFLTDHCKLRKLYGSRVINERHRHRYEVNPRVVPKLSQAGLLFVGMGRDEKLPNIGGNPLPYAALVKASKYENLRKVEENGIEVDRNTDTREQALLLSKIEVLCRIGSEEASTTSVRMEIVELKDHPYFVGVQFHPEYLSHPLQPSPPFFGLICAASGQLESFLRGSKIPSPVSVLKEAENYGPNVAENVLQATHSFVNKVGVLTDKYRNETGSNDSKDC